MPIRYVCPCVLDDLHIQYICIIFIVSRCLYMHVSCTDLMHTIQRMRKYETDTPWTETSKIKNTCCRSFHRIVEISVGEGTSRRRLGAKRSRARNMIMRLCWNWSFKSRKYTAATVQQLSSRSFAVHAQFTDACELSQQTPSLHRTTGA